MPKAGSRSSRSTRSSPPTSLDVHHCSMEQLAHLLTEVLRLHLLSRHLITSETKLLMVQRLYHAIQNIDKELPNISTGPASSMTTSSPITTQSSMPQTTSVPAYSTQPTMSAPGSQLTDIAARDFSQPELQSQFSSIMTTHLLNFR